MKDIFGNYRSWLLAEQQNSTLQHNKEVLQGATIGMADESAYDHIVHPYYVMTTVDGVFEELGDNMYRLVGDGGVFLRIGETMESMIRATYDSVALLDPNKDPISAANNYRGYSQAAEDIAGPESKLAKLLEEFMDYEIPLASIRRGYQDQTTDLSRDIIRYMQDFYLQSIPALQKEKLGKHLGSGMYGAVFQFADKKGVVFKIGTRYTISYEEEKEKVGKETKFYDDAMNDLFSKKATKSTLPVYDHGQVLLGEKNLAKIKEFIVNRLTTESRDAKGILVYVKLLLGYLDEINEMLDRFLDMIPNDVLMKFDAGGKSKKMYNQFKSDKNRLADYYYKETAQFYNERKNKIAIILKQIAEMYGKQSLYYAEIGEVNVAEAYTSKEIGDRIPPELKKLSKQFSQYGDISISEALSTQMGNAYENIRMKYQLRVGERGSAKDRGEIFKKSKNFKQYIQTVSSDDYWDIDFNFDNEIELGFRSAFVAPLRAMEDQFLNGKILQLVKPTREQKKKVADEMNYLFDNLTKHLRKFYKEFVYKSFEAVYDLEKKLSKTTGRGGQWLWDKNTFDVHFGNFGFAADGTAVIYDP
jgi:hypothetical protein